ncbi:prepilin-type N-terminal cleavage/methylation domain-containing protein, partial [Variovorax sp. WDL1]
MRGLSQAMTSKFLSKGLASPINRLCCGFTLLELLVVLVI